MHEYDVALKNILTRKGSALLAALTGREDMRWLNVETPRVRNLRVDLLGEEPGGDLVQIEFQSRNEKDLPIRMGEYLFAIGRKHGRMPRQIVLYVGEARLRMTGRIEIPERLSYRFDLIDVRDLDGEALLASPNPGDNVVAVLTGLGDRPDTVRRILSRIGKGPVSDREQALAEFFIVAALRKISRKAREEARRMPIHLDIRDDEFIGPLIADGQRKLLTSQIKKKFGRIPPAIRERLDALSSRQLEKACLRLLDARRIEDVFAR